MEGVRRLQAEIPLAAPIVHRCRTKRTSQPAGLLFLYKTNTTVWGTMINALRYKNYLWNMGEHRWSFGYLWGEII